MRIKSKEIARALNLSEATVSLALNNRPGVKAETRIKIQNYLADLEFQKGYREKPNIAINKGCILMISYVKHGLIMMRSGSSGPVIQKMEDEVIQAGYTFSTMRFHENRDKVETLFRICRSKDVKGIYILASEMEQADIYPFLKLNVPIAAGDNLFYDQGVNCFLIDNREGIRHGVDYLIGKGHSHIIYLAETIDIFNFQERREAFIHDMERQNCGAAGNRIWYLGCAEEEIYHSMIRYLDQGLKKTTAFILESSRISLGVIKALLERKIRIPRDISLVGFDALPPDSLLGMQLTLIKGTHSRRHLAGVKSLLRHIEDREEEVVSIYYKTRLLEGESVFDKTKYIY